MTRVECLAARRGHALSSTSTARLDFQSGKRFTVRSVHELGHTRLEISRDNLINEICRRPPPFILFFAEGLEEARCIERFAEMSCALPWQRQP
jgi:hypothetical protein